ncbi:hypothetical protein GDO81_029294 [Engystomops pustulosus]|uniref:Uncharacterized protein n=1 Tax=Engystomops pustulosus TaxID=76066 RepID=A0AAV6YC81_ENGPU|nr:hypothetical protein GDO81_029294 [Engystomops pustulosus]
MVPPYIGITLQNMGEYLDLQAESYLLTLCNHLHIEKLKYNQNSSKITCNVQIHKVQIGGWDSLHPQARGPDPSSIPQCIVASWQPPGTELSWTCSQCPCTWIQT